MYTFNIQPDFDKLRAYFPQYSDDQYANLVSIYQLQSSYTTDKFRQKDAEIIEATVKSLSEEYGLSEHFHNLLYLALSGYDVIQSKYDTIHRNWEESARSKELAMLLLLFQKQNATSISVRSYNEKVEVKDQMLIKWIGDLISDTVAKKQFPLTLLGGSALRDLFGHHNPLAAQPLDSNQLKKAVVRRDPDPDEEANQLLSEFCSHIYNYLEVYSTLKAKEGKMFSDIQLNFLFELSRIFNLTHPKHEVFDKNYMRSTLRRHLKKFPSI